jgi:hypothetical protein
VADYTIVVKGGEEAVEALANEANIYPGHLMDLLSTGKVQMNDTVAQPIERIVAIEDYLQGNDIANAYTNGERVSMRKFLPNDVALLVLADGENVAIGDYVEPTTGGEVKKLAVNSDGVTVTNKAAVLGVAVTAVDASDSATTALASRRIKIRFV